MRQEDLKSGITKEWLRKTVDSEGIPVDREIWVDEYGIWHEIGRDGQEITYDRTDAEVLMHDGREVESLPEEYRICGFWLRLKGLWVAPMVCLNYKNNPATSQVVYTEEKDNHDGTKTIYTETLILNQQKGARVHVVHTTMDKEQLTRVEEKCWSCFVDLN